MDQWGQPCDFHRPPVQWSNQILMSQDKGVFRPTQDSETRDAYLDLSAWGAGFDKGGTPADVKQIYMWQRPDSSVSSGYIWWPCEDGSEPNPVFKELKYWGCPTDSSGASKPIQTILMCKTQKGAKGKVWWPCDPTATGADYKDIKFWGRP
jgi:hypothetical protein